MKMAHNSGKKGYQIHPGEDLLIVYPEAEILTNLLFLAHSQGTWIWVDNTHMY